MQNLILGKKYSKKNITSTLQSSSFYNGQKEVYSTKTILHSINTSTVAKTTLNKPSLINQLPVVFENKANENQAIVWPPFMNELDAMFEEYKNDYGSLRYFYLELVNMHANNIEPLLGARKQDPELIKLCIGIPELKWKALQQLEDMQIARVNMLAENLDSYIESDLLLLLQRCIDARHTFISNSLDAIEQETRIRAIRKILHPEFSIVAIPNRGLIAKKVIQIASQNGYITVSTVIKMRKIPCCFADYVIFIKDKTSMKS